MSEESQMHKDLGNELTELKTMLFESFLVHLEECEEITPLPDRYIMDKYDEWLTHVKSRLQPLHADLLERINVLRNKNVDISKN